MNFSSFFKLYSKSLSFTLLSLILILYRLQSTPSIFPIYSYPNPSLVFLYSSISILITFSLTLHLPYYLILCIYTPGVLQISISHQDKEICFDRKLFPGPCVRDGVYGNLYHPLVIWNDIYPLCLVLGARLVQVVVSCGVGKINK